MNEQDFASMALTPYDEFPVHSTPYPMSYVPGTDLAWPGATASRPRRIRADLRVEDLRSELTT